MPAHIIKNWQLDDGEYGITDALYGEENSLKVQGGTGHISLKLEPLQSYIYQLK